MLNENIDGKWICSIADSEYWRSTEHFDTKEDALTAVNDKFYTSLSFEEKKIQTHKQSFYDVQIILKC